MTRCLNCTTGTVSFPLVLITVQTLHVRCRSLSALPCRRPSYIFPSSNWFIPAVNNSAGCVFRPAGRPGRMFFRKRANVSWGMWPPSGVRKARGQPGFILGQVCAFWWWPRPKPSAAAAPPSAAAPPALLLLTSRQFWDSSAIKLPSLNGSRRIQGHIPF